MITLPLILLALSQHATLDQVFQEFQVTDLTHPEIKTEVVEDGGCAPFYYVEMRFPGVFENHPATIEIDMQTLTPENMKRISDALQAGYPQHGLPECMKSDTYNDEEWIYDELHNTLFIPASFKGDHGTCYGSQLPYTNCVKAKDIYPSS